MLPAACSVLLARPVLSSASMSTTMRLAALLACRATFAFHGHPIALRSRSIGGRIALRTDENSLRSASRRFAGLALRGRTLFRASVFGYRLTGCGRVGGRVRLLRVHGSLVGRLAFFSLSQSGSPCSLASRFDQRLGGKNTRSNSIKREPTFPRGGKVRHAADRRRFTVSAQGSPGRPIVDPPSLRLFDLPQITNSRYV